MTEQQRLDKDLEYGRQTAALAKMIVTQRAVAEHLARFPYQADDLLDVLEWCSACERVMLNLFGELADLRRGVLTAANESAQKRRGDDGWRD